MKHTIFLLCALLCACPKNQGGDTGPVSGFTDGPPPPPPPVTEGPADGPPPPILECPGETQCPCEGGCPEGQMCGPARACTKSCVTNGDCNSGVSGESCIANLCGVPCTPEAPESGCGDAGMHGATCLLIFGTYVCGYEAP